MKKYCLSAKVCGVSDFPNRSRVYILNWSPGFKSIEVIGTSMRNSNEMAVQTISSQYIEGITYRIAPLKIEHKFVKLYDSEPTIKKISSAFNRTVSTKRTQFNTKLVSPKVQQTTTTDFAFRETMVVGALALIVTLAFAYYEIQSSL